MYPVTQLEGRRTDDQVRAGLRLTSVDALRGLIMVIMALDHVRDFFHSGAMSFLPEDLARTNAALFLTRWITHFCAPVFFFTAGIGAYFWLSRPGRTQAGLSKFLFTRGVWLIILELTAVRFALLLNLTSGPLLLTILWALGASMVILAVLCRLPVRVLAPLSLAVIALHNLTDPIQAANFGRLAFLWNILHQQGAFVAGGIVVVVAYPILPWAFVMAAGYCFGRILQLEPERRQRMLFRIGIAATAAFLALRALNIYGDPSPWSAAIPGKTILSFLRCTKYPPSLLFLLMTLGPAIALLGWLDRVRLSRSNPLVIIGRVPLFFFLAHLLLAHLLAFPLALLRYGAAGFLLSPMPSTGGSKQLYPADFGYSLPVVYLIWISVVVLLYPLCVWFSRVKQRRNDWWLSYL
jgi:uncharacterized membrane protein